MKTPEITLDKCEAQEEGVRGAWIDLPTDVSSLSDLGHQLGFVTNMTRLLAAHPRIGPIFRKLSTEILFGPGHLARREREMVGAVAAAAQDCHY